MLIAVDHGNKQIKTVHTPPFTSGLIQSDTPGFGTDAGLSGEVLHIDRPADPLPQR